MLLYRSSCQTISGSILSVLLLVTLSSQTRGQPVTLDDLAGVAVEANINRRQNMQRDGRAYSIQARQNWQFDINADKTIDMTVNTAYQGPRGERKAPPNSGRFSLEDSQDVTSRGGGKGMWSFDDGTLHFTRTFHQEPIGRILHLPGAKVA